MTTGRINQVTFVSDQSRLPPIGPNELGFSNRALAHSSGENDAATRMRATEWSAFLPTNSCTLKLATRHVSLVGQPEPKFWQVNGESAYEACNSACAAIMQAVGNRCSSQPNENEHNSQEPSHLRPTDYWRDMPRIHEVE